MSSFHVLRSANCHKVVSVERKLRDNKVSKKEVLDRMCVGQIQDASVNVKLIFHAVEDLGFDSCGRQTIVWGVQVMVSPFVTSMSTCCSPYGCVVI